MRLDWAMFSANDQATFGGHRWRAGSRSAHHCPAELASYAELPPYAESQTAWKPYYTGLSENGELALCFVTPDRSAGRTNRLTTHVLFVPITAPSLWDALVALQDPSLFTGTGPIHIPTAPPPPQPNSAVSAEVQRVLHAFATVRNSRIVVQSGDEKLFLNALWEVLWPSGRRSFTFRRHFHPREISPAIQSPQLILVPDGTAWTREPGFHVIRPQGNAPLLPPVTVGPEFEGSLVQLRIYLTLAGGLKRLKEADLSDLQNLWGLLGIVPLSKAAEQEFEARISAAMTARLPHATSEEILTLQGVVDMHGSLTETISSWIQSRLATGLSLPDQTWIEQVVTAQDWMLSGLREGLRHQSPSEPAAASLWAWMSPAHGRELLAALQQTWENAFIRTCPESPPSAATQWAARKGWWTLHAHLEIRKDLPAGLRTVLKKTPSHQIQEVLRTIRTSTDTRKLIQALEDIEDEAALTLASAMVMDQPILRSFIRADSDWWRQVWTRSLSGFRSAFDGLPEPERLQKTLIDEQIAHGHVPTVLLTAVAQTGVHFLERTDRATLWPRFPTAFLTNTAAAFVRAQTSPGQPDEALLEAIRTSDFPITSDAAAQELARHLSHLTDEQARTVLQRLQGTAREHVQELHMRSTGLLSRLYGTLSERVPDWLAPVLPDDMKLERAAKRGEVLPDDLWWTLAFRIIPDTVPESPHNYWAAAKGKINMLQENGSSRTKWVAALHIARSAQKPRIEALLDQILKNYSSAQLKQLKQTKGRGRTEKD